jgi:hypothetical protein
MIPSVADRERVTRILQESFIAGRLTRGELEQRVEQVITSRDFRELLALMSDLPAHSPLDRLPAHRITPRPPARYWRVRRWLARAVGQSGHGNAVG